MNELPNHTRLPVNLLAACFKDTAATYKFYWFLSILQTVEQGERTISKRKLFAKMLSNAWFTVNYFHVSFGKQDLIQDAIHKIKVSESISIKEKREVITEKLIATSKRDTEKTLRHFNKYVPHRFLSPWFPKEENETDAARKRRIYSESSTFKSKCLYNLLDDRVEMNPDWENYLIDNVRILKDFCYWNLALYLQGRNPNVPDIPNKLIKPAFRNSLILQKRNFWDFVIEKNGFVECIYTGEKMQKGEYDLDHFVPYAFVSHNLIWNLIPIYPPYNSTKGDKLPMLDKHFNSYFNLQKEAIEIVRKNNPNNKFLEDYLTIFSDLETVSTLPENFTQEKFKERLQPLITIASNNGFVFLK